MTTGYLGTILENTREEIVRAKEKYSLAELRSRPLYDRATYSLREALRSRHPAVIAEVKKASPSKGVIRENFDHRAIAADYARSGAAALSVLTDERFFQGNLSFLEDIRPIVDIPVLRKDFIVDSYQLHEAKAYGADAVLLIAAALEPAQLNALRQEAGELGLECLIEVHTREEIESLEIGFDDIVGINNRDLQSFVTDLSVSRMLRNMLPGHVTVVSESGIQTGKDVRQLIDAGIDAVLVGESLMRAAEPGTALAHLLSEAMRRED